MFDPTTQDSEKVQAAVAAAAAGDRATFKALWASMSEAERWRMRAHARVNSITKQSR